MPYIRQEDRALLDPQIKNLQAKAGVLNLSGNILVTWSYARYICLEILNRSSMRAAEQYRGIKNTRDWQIIYQCGIVTTIGREYYRRIVTENNLPMMPFNSQSISRELPSDVLMLEQEISDLVNTISTIAGPKENNCEGSYCGLVVYALTELVPRIMVDGLDVQKQEFSMFLLVAICYFWAILGAELYQIACDYQDSQMRLHGDADVYSFLRSRLLDDGGGPEDNPLGSNREPPDRKLPPDFDPTQPLQEEDEGEEGDDFLNRKTSYKHDSND